MVEKNISDIDYRISQWVEFVVGSKLFKSEADLLRNLEFPLTKLSDARKGKAKFRADDIGKILIMFPGVSSEWIMTGRGEMFLTEEKMPERELISELKRVNKNYEEMKEERDEWYFKARKYEEELQKYRSSVKTDEAV